MGLVAIVDIDGTLVDSTYHHALAWHRAFRGYGLVLPMWRVHRHIGMGADQLVRALGGELSPDSEQAIRSDHARLFEPLVAEVELLPGARELLEALKLRTYTLVLASSASGAEVDHYLDLLDARDLCDAWISGDEVRRTKPQPDLVQAGLEAVGGQQGLLIGDSTFDCIAAKRAGIEAIGVLTGGFCSAELYDAGAARVYESLEQLIANLDRMPFSSSS